MCRVGIAKRANTSSEVWRKIDRRRDGDDDRRSYFFLHPKIARPLSLLVDTRTRLSQAGTTEPDVRRQERLKLVTQLKREVGRAADEQIEKRKAGIDSLLLENDDQFAATSNCFSMCCMVAKHRIVIEHNLVIAEAVLSISVEGRKLGEVVACGTPEQVAKNRLSRTAPFLRKVLKTSRAKTTLSS
jgi:excinuclease ABC subunit A